MKKKSISILLALFFSFFTYIYTWEKDKINFFVLIILQLIFFNLLFSLIIWIGTLGMVSIRKEIWYEKYNISEVKHYGKEKKEKEKIRLYALS